MAQPQCVLVVVVAVLSKLRVRLAVLAVVAQVEATV
jgi:hypothetical protein